MSAVPADAAADAEAAFGGLVVETELAPIHRLDNGALSAVELQLRGPEGSSLHDATALSETARAMHQKPVLDRIKWQRAGRHSQSAVPHLITVDLDSLDELGVLDDRPEPVTVVLITEQALIASPARTLRTIAAARTAGMLVAVDGVGARAQALALLPLVEPDVIITSPALIDRAADASTARIAHAVAAYIESSNAVVIAQGVDSELHRRRALGLAAEYGMGKLYPVHGTRRDAAQSNSVVDPMSLLPRPAIADDPALTPFALASEGRRRTRSFKRLLVSMSKLLETNAVGAGPETIVLGTFQRAEHFTPTSRARWAQLAEQVAYTGIYGVGIDPYVDSAVHHAPLDPDDPMVDEWNVVVLGPHFACVLAALDMHTDAADLDREFHYVLSYDRGTVIRCAHSILARFEG
ncbi:EAL domain-containing protein [Rhodococcus sp. B50]|uniref:EAL domain-containing protein n=1 Tax=Rhodococcus sp. B50 TaxID=2682847 RepID=UPI001BD68B68|nr:EAL domain-containing protein [Rhodococcus sp. B50]MBS9375236.1 hypothetical protein [Rhodococcus sp. B50]